MTDSRAADGRGLFVYAVVPAGRALPDGVMGVDGAPLALVPYGDLAAVVGDVALDRPPGRRADLTAYSGVMESLMSLGAVAPIRFGCVLPDEAAVVHELLAPREAHLSSLLEELEGRVQYNVRASYVDDAVLAEIVRGDLEIQRLRDRTRDAPEEAFVGDRVRLGELVSHAWERLARIDADHLLAQVLPITSAHAVRRQPGPQAALDVALLVETSRSQELEDHLELLAHDAGGRMELTLIGPLAPYDFVGSA